MTLTFGSLFSGIGGFDLGLERAGMVCRWQVEIDKDCGAVLSRHWPGVERFEDITAVSGLPAVDVLCGGFPCQDLSVAGRRAGLAGERSGLFYEFMRLAAELRPTWLCIENVPGLLSSNDGRDMGTVLGTLGRLRYGYAYRVLDAQYFGVAQRRRRVFIVGHADARCAAQVLFEPESCSGDPPPSREAGQRAAGTLTGGAHGTSSHGKKSGTDREGFLVPDVAYTLPASARGTGDGHGNAWNSNYIAATLRSRQHADGVNPPGRGGEDDQNLVVAHALCSPTAKGGDPTTDTYIAFQTSGYGAQTDDVVPTLQASHDRLSNQLTGVIAHTLRAEGSDASEDGTGRGVPLVCDTTQITSGANYSNPKPGDACHPLASGAHPPLMVQPSVRRLTPIECERLQGFPDGWTAGASDSARYRMLGNAVCVPVAQWIAQRIVEAAS